MPWIRSLLAVTAVAALPALPKVGPLPALQGSGLTAQAWTAVDKQPGNPAVGFGSVWVPSSASGILDRVDAHSLKVVTRIRTSSATTSAQNEYFDSVAVSSNAVWQASDVGNEVIRVEPRRNRVVTHIAVPGRPGAIATSASSVYVPLFNTTSVLRIDAAHNRIARRRDLHVPALGIAYGAKSVWVVTSTGPAILQLDPVTLAIKRRISIASTKPPLGGYFSAWWVSADDSTVCAANQQQNLVSVVHAHSGKLMTQTVLPSGSLPFSVAADGTSCWATNKTGVFLIAPGGSPPSSSQLPPLGPSAFTGVAAGAGNGWVTIAGRNALLRVARS